MTSSIMGTRAAGRSTWTTRWEDRTAGATGSWLDRVYRFLKSIPTWHPVVPRRAVERFRPFGLFVNGSLRTRDAQRDSGLVGRCFLGGEAGFTLRELRRPSSALVRTVGSSRRSLLNSLAIAVPATDDSDCDRGLRRVRVRVDGLQGPGVDVQHHGRRCLAIPLQMALDPVAPDCTSGGAHWTLPVPRSRRSRSSPYLNLRRVDDCGVAHPHGVRAAVSRSSCSTTTSRRLPAGHHGVGSASTAPSHYTIFMAAHPAAVGSGARGLCDLPVPVDLERLPDRQHVRRQQPRRASDDDPHRQPRR